ncbi:MAG: hypothetical protein KGL41_03445 [Actinomycetales bacterium]|nr:hypothetical protein [Actinomycetales bacterium]
MPRRRTNPETGRAAVAACLACPDGPSADPQFATAVRYLLEELAERAPGNTVEVRVPPLGATQCIPGPRHTRGTPPNVVEMSPETWFALATGSLLWDDAIAGALVLASGVRADLDGLFPLYRDFGHPSV